VIHGHRDDIEREGPVPPPAFAEVANQHGHELLQVHGTRHQAAFVAEPACRGVVTDDAFRSGRGIARYAPTAFDHVLHRVYIRLSGAYGLARTPAVDAVRKLFAVRRVLSA